MPKNRKCRSYKNGMFLLVVIAASLASWIKCNQADKNRQNEVTFDYLDDDRDHAKAIAIDQDGSIYVTGASNSGETMYDYATLKYDPDGTSIWVSRYDGPVNGQDISTSISVDKAGNVYVTGRSDGGDTSSDYTTVAYDKNGILRWVRRYNGPGNGDDRATSMITDGKGNVYVTGRSHGEETSYDYATVKYDQAGMVVWIERYNGPGNGDDIASAITIGVDGNIYVTGRSFGENSNYDYATIKYSSDGTRLWVTRYNGPGNGEDHATSIAVNCRGNIYVTGTSVGDGTGFDWATIAYDSDSNVLWSARYNSEGSGWDGADAIAVDTNGNTFVTGYGGKARDYTTIKYDSGGSELWVKKYNGKGNATDVTTDIALDDNGNAYVTGYCNNGISYADYVTIKYDPAGRLLWLAEYNGPGNSEDRPRAISLDERENVYLTGESLDSITDFDFATIKYDKDGNQLWVARYDHGVYQARSRRKSNQNR
ncbi:MAG: SBBP repeat-containing protein [Candidatus Glassbacteria bacterium]